MTAMRAPRTTFTPEEYLLLERHADERHEYLDGHIYAVAGATPAHEAIVANLIGLLWSVLSDGPRQVYGSNLRMKTPADRMYCYPDVTVICGEPAFHDGHRDVVTNPTVVFEIASPSTERFDRGEKLDRYRDVESLMAHVLVSQNEPAVELLQRDEHGTWARGAISGLDSSLWIQPIDCALPLRSIYRRVLG